MSTDGSSVSSKQSAVEQQHANSSSLEDEPQEGSAPCAIDEIGLTDMCADEMCGGADEVGGGDAFDQTALLYRCGVCNERLVEPRVLQCLHVFCTRCLVKLSECGDNASTDPTTIICPSCKQVGVSLPSLAAPEGWWEVQV